MLIILYWIALSIVKTVYSLNISFINDVKKTFSFSIVNNKQLFITHVHMYINT